MSYSHPAHRGRFRPARTILDIPLYASLVAGMCALPVYAADSQPSSGSATNATDPQPSTVAAAGELTAADPDATTDTLPEVVVGARKRQENEQDVPISIVAISGDQLDASHVFLAGDIVRGIPDMNFQFINPRQTAFSIRGLGNNPANEGLETSVGLYLDGVYLSRPGMLSTDLLDIDHIEVLRGPQGTLFGKNTTAGAVNIITRGPESTFSADTTVSAGDYGFLQEKADVTGPLTSDLSGRLSVYHTGRDGTITDTTNGQLLNNENKTGARAQLLLDSDETFTLRLIADWAHQQEDSGAQVLVNPGLDLADGQIRPNNIYVRSARFGYIPVFDPFARQVAIDEPQTIATTSEGLSAEANWKTGGGFTLTSISAWRNWAFYPQNDLDYLPLDIESNEGGNVWNRQVSEELRLASPVGGAVDYVVGAYLYWQRVNTLTVPGPSYGSDAAEFYSSPTLILPSYTLNGVTSTTFSTTPTRSYALFGQETWHLNSLWDWTTGIRSTYDDKDTEVVRTASGGVALDPSDPDYAAEVAARKVLAPPAAAQTARVTGDTVSGMSSLSFTPREGVLLYATVARGAKSGGLNTSIIPAGVNPVVEPEIAKSAELGLKTTLNRTLQADLDVFLTDIDNYQTTIRDPILLTSYLANARGVRSKGVEFSGSWLPLDGLRLDAGGAYDEAIYTSFNNSPCPIEDTGIATICNLTGKPVSGAPRWTSDLDADYTHGVRTLDGYGGIELQYRSSNYYTTDDSIYSLIPSYSLVNAHVGLRSEGNSWDLSLWVLNLFNKQYFTALNNPSGGAFASGYIVGSIGDPRTYGATLEVRF
jgi:iron complex outermembrane recepter protein